MNTIHNFHYDKSIDCFMGSFFSVLSGTEINVIVDKDVPNDYIAICIKHFNSLAKPVVDTIRHRLTKYCQFMFESWQEMGIYEKVLSNIESKMACCNTSFDIFHHIQLQTMVIETPKQSVPAYSLSGNCDWEPEHGFEIIIKDNDVLYVGQPTMIGPWGNAEDYRCIY